MGFPKHNILPADCEHPLFKQLHQKRLGFSPYTFCEFFQGFDVLQIYGEKTKEYIFALYFNGNLVGHVYFGDVLTDKDIRYVQKNFMPPTWSQIDEFVKKTSEVWYSKFAPSQYAFVFDRILEKVV